jgi:fused signal recognition particle receptor
MFFPLFSRRRPLMSETLSETKGKTLLQKLGSIVRKGSVVDDSLIEHLEESLITADIGVNVTTGIIEEIREQYSDETIDSEEKLYSIIKRHMIDALKGGEREIRTSSDDSPTVILVVGVNGTGKTTSIGKLADVYVKQGKKVLLGAGDTFRAGAGEQISIWAERTGADLVSHKEGGDPAAVIFDTVEAGVARKSDYIILDTAGRLHTKNDLMKQLEKINRVIKKKISEAPHEVLLVLDATAGQNGLAQTKKFYDDVGVTGIFLAKTDGTARGGIIFSIQKQLGIPVKFVGTGEKAEDIKQFDPEEFVENLFHDQGSAGMGEEIDRSLEDKMSIKKLRKPKYGIRFKILSGILAVVSVLFVLYLIFKDIWFGFIQEILNETGLMEYFQ